MTYASPPATRMLREWPHVSTRLAANPGIGTFSDVASLAVGLALRLKRGRLRPIHVLYARRP